MENRLKRREEPPGTVSQGKFLSGFPLPGIPKLASTYVSRSRAVWGIPKLASAYSSRSRAVWGLKSTLYMQIFPTKAFETFPDALEAVSQEEVFQTNTPSAAAFACAGPVASNKCEMTNLDWTIDGDYLSATHGIRYDLRLLILHGQCTASALQVTIEGRM